MNHIGSAADRRSASEITSDARALQARHAPQALAAAGQWLRGAFSRRVGASGPLEARRLIVH